MIVRPTGAAGAESLALWLRQEQATLHRLLAEHGALLFRDFPVSTLEDFEAVCRAGTPRLLDYKGGGSIRSRVRGQVYNSTEYAPDQPIPLHCETSYLLDMPAHIWLFCHTPPTEAGETPVGDMARVLQRLDPALVERFERRGGVRYVYNLHGGDGFGRGWKDAFLTQDRADVEAWLHERRIREYHWTAAGGLHVELVAPSLRVHPATGVTVWGNQAVNWHVASLSPATVRGLRRLYESELNFPKHALFADGSPIADEDIHAILGALAAEEVALPWQRGDVLLCDNLRTAHGRRPFKGERRILVALA